MTLRNEGDQEAQSGLGGEGEKVAVAREQVGVGVGTACRQGSILGGGDPTYETQREVGAEEGRNDGG